MNPLDGGSEKEIIDTVATVPSATGYMPQEIPELSVHPLLIVQFGP
jgi:hypothetical protein